MGDTTALTSAVSTLAANFATLVTDIDNAITVLKAAVAANDQPAIDAATQKISAIASQAASEAAALATELNPPPAPPPAV